MYDIYKCPHCLEVMYYDYDEDSEDMVGCERCDRPSYKVTQD